MNSGDTVKIILNYTVDGVPISEGAFDEIEFSIGRKRYTLSDEKIAWDEAAGAYSITLTQEDTFALAGDQRYQIRLKKDGEVVSSGISVVNIGRSISKRVI